MGTVPTIAVLAGGLATRLGELTKETPKSLIDVLGRPFLAWQLELFATSGIEEVVLCVAHYAEQIEEWVAKHPQPGLRVRFSVDGERQMGTGGAVQRALPMLGDVFLVTYGDSYLRCDYRAVYAHFEQVRGLGAGTSRPQGLMTVFRNENQFDESNVLFRHDQIELYSKRNRIQEMQHIDWGLGVLTRDALDSFDKNEPLDLAGVYEKLVSERRLAGLEMQERFYEVGSRRGIEDFRRYASARC